MRRILLRLLTATFTLTPVLLHAQVTTATLYGVVRDSTAASVPGALITVLNQGTGQSREIASVGFDGILSQPPLDAHHRKKGINKATKRLVR